MEANMKEKRIWLAWERQRRSLELAKAFDASIFIIDVKSTAFLRYFFSILKTIKVLYREKPTIVFAQNPSLVLASLVCFLRPIFNYKIVIDRHTNFKFEHRHSKQPKWLVFKCLNKYSLKKANLTIVTNKYLKILVNKAGGRSVVLPDKLPMLGKNKMQLKHQTDYSALFVCTYALDEPFREIFKAASLCPEVTIYVTGDYKKSLSEDEINYLPGNVLLLGFVSDECYIEYLNSVDFTIILTTQEFTLNCGSYESIVAGKPMLLSNTKTIKTYFNKGCVYSESFEPIRLAGKINELATDLPNYSVGIEHSRTKIMNIWPKMFREVLSNVENL